MQGVVFQDWTTVREDSTSSTFTQSEALWLNVDDYSDVVFWLEVESVVIGSSLQLSYETAPTKGDVLFQAVTNSVCLLTSTQPVITKVINGQSNLPLSSWLRWKVSTVGLPFFE